jgi:hypothetical protein
MAVKDAQRIKKLCRKVAEEQDPEKFLSLIEELSQLFEEEDPRATFPVVKSHGMPNTSGAFGGDIFVDRRSGRTMPGYPAASFLMRRVCSARAVFSW